MLDKSFLIDKDYEEVAEIEFIREDHFHKLLSANGNLMDIELGVFKLNSREE